MLLNRSNNNMMGSSTTKRRRYLYYGYDYYKTASTTEDPSGPGWLPGCLDARAHQVTRLDPQVRSDVGVPIMFML